MTECCTLYNLSRYRVNIMNKKQFFLLGQFTFVKVIKPKLIFLKIALPKLRIQKTNLQNN